MIEKPDSGTIRTVGIVAENNLSAINDDKSA
jgi:hypothetical protein